jgi:hypothetical protein
LNSSSVYPALEAKESEVESIIGSKRDGGGEKKRRMRGQQQQQRKSDCLHCCSLTFPTFLLQPNEQFPDPFPV